MNFIEYFSKLIFFNQSLKPKLMLSFPFLYIISSSIFDIHYLQNDLIYLRKLSEISQHNKIIMVTSRNKLIVIKKGFEMEEIVEGITK